ncbi:Shedu anti-phage system protein SduA domain-containing protein, partial [Vibrio alfacsensis]|uniref:Shedu anti-phage system protein SduA domain-containing protein n=1 Tax=Vibrio alfacsensis TaxID=1074311 RepID=UPI004067C514
MISLQSGTLSRAQCRKELDEFHSLLQSNTEIGETKLLKFFKNRSQLILLMGRVVAIDAPEKFNDELPIIGKFRADFVVADKSQTSFAFIEFEDAKENSIFNKVLNRKTSVYPWSSRFEHGYSQVIDWYLHLAANDNSVNMQSEFGSFSIKYYGALIILITTNSQPLEMVYIYRDERGGGLC